MPDNWRLIYPGTDFAFGSVGSGFVFSEAPDLGTVEMETDDFARPLGDGVAFGADYRRGRTIAFAIDVNDRDAAHARERLAQLAAAWRADTVRTRAGATAELVSDTGRSAFGRPRRFAPNLEELPSGLVAVTADFTTTDDLWYGAEQVASVNLAPPTGGGLLAPLSAPLLTTAPSNRSTTLTVDGETSTWPVFEVAGPIVNPIVEIVGALRMEFRLTLAYDERLVIDSRPWGRSILRRGSNAAGSLSPSSTRLSRAALPLGTHELVLRGTSDGLASLTARWRPAFHTP